MKGKPSYPVQSDNDISMYYLQNQNWAAVGYGSMVKLPCLGTAHPPTVIN